MDIGALAHAFFNTAGVGGFLVVGIFLLAGVIYVVLTRWILDGDRSQAGAGLTHRNDQYR